MGIDLHDYQTTVKSRVSLSGTGVHSGQPVSIHFNPADADTGVIFQISGGAHDGAEIRGLYSEIGSTDLCTVVGSLGGAHVATIEHLMASLFGLGIDNVIVEVEGNEVPILDGSAAAYVEAFDEVGLEILPVRRRFIRVLKTVRVENGASWAEFRPYDGTRFEKIGRAHV